MLKTKIGRIYEQVKYELSVFFVMLALAVPQSMDFSSQAYSTLLALDYRVGFAPRIFMGSVLSIFTDFRGRRAINIFYIVMFLLAFLLIAWLAGRLIRSAEPAMKSTMIALIALFLALPYTAAFLYPQTYPPDRFLIYFTLLGLVVFDKPYVRWLLPLLLFAALATHHMFVFAYMPVFAVLLFYILVREGSRFKNLFFCFVNLGLTAMLSVYFYLFSGIKGISLEQLYDYAQARTDLSVDRSAESIFKGYFFLEPSLVFEYNTEHGPGVQNILDNELTAAIFLLPIIAFFVYLWVDALRKSVDRRNKLIFILCLLAPLARVPLFFVNTEVYRGRMAVLLVQFFLLFYFLYDKNTAVKASLEKVAGLLKNNLLPSLLLFAYYAAAFSTYNFGDSWTEFFTSLFR